MMSPISVERFDWGALRDALSEASRGLKDDDWPVDALKVCAEHNVYRWFAPIELGGFGWADQEIARGYLEISQVSLTTAFILTQRTAAVSRILASTQARLPSNMIESLVDGTNFVTVGISHLTTSRQHVSKPVLRARWVGEHEIILEGYSPWVTGGCESDAMVIGATMEDGDQVLVLVNTNAQGIQTHPGMLLTALTGSKTDRVEFDGVRVGRDHVLFGPSPEVMKAVQTGGAGGLTTSTLALGLAKQAISFLQEESQDRADLRQIAEQLSMDWMEIWQDLMALMDGSGRCSQELIRQQANSIALRATQSAMIAAKGAGYLLEHPVSRWCREALFFLVWSCPKTVAQANLCELAGIEF